MGIGKLMDGNFLRIKFPDDAPHRKLSWLKEVECIRSGLKIPWLYSCGIHVELEVNGERVYL